MPEHRQFRNRVCYHPLRVKQAGGLTSGLALVFDLDGVVVDSNPVHTETWRLYLERHGVEADEDMPRRMFGRRNDDIVRDLFGPGLSQEEVTAHGAAKERLYREVMRDQLQHRMVPGLASFLERHRDAPLGVASNAEPENVAFVLDCAGLRPYFKVVVDGHQVQRPKPSPDIFLKAAELLEAAPGNCVVFEDSLAGVEAAVAAGARVVGVCTTHGSLPGVQLEIEDFRSIELESWLRRQIPLS